MAKKAQIPGHVSPHSMRHTFATINLDAGGTLRDLQDRMGHADPRTTRRYDLARGNLAKSVSYTVAGALGLQAGNGRGWCPGTLRFQEGLLVRCETKA